MTNTYLDGARSSALTNNTYLNGLDNMFFRPPLNAGDRVEYVGTFSPDLIGAVGTVLGVDETPGRDAAEVQFDGHAGTNKVMAENIRVIAAQKQERFLTAYKDGPDFTLTGDNAFNTQRDADNHANEIAANEPDVTVVVLKVMSQHSSRIVVTTEHAA